MPDLQNLLAIAAFALAVSATPGPVNIIAAMTGAAFGAGRAVPFVAGAASGFLALLLVLGLCLSAGAVWLSALTRPLTVIGGGYLLWLAWKLARKRGQSSEPILTSLPGFRDGATVQASSPKAWLAASASISTFVVPSQHMITSFVIFSALFIGIGFCCIMLWVVAGDRFGRASLTWFNRSMGLLLALSVLWMGWETFR